MCWSSATKRWRLAGITSWGSACKRNSAPGVYTDARYFAAWIRAKMSAQHRKKRRS